MIGQNLSHTSRAHGRQNPVQLSAINPSSVLPVSHLVTNHMPYCEAQSDGDASNPNAPQFNTRLPPLTLGAANEHGVNSMANISPEHRRNESSSSTRTGPIIAKTPEDL